MKKTTHIIIEELKSSLLGEAQSEYNKYKKLHLSIQELRFFLTSEDIFKIKYNELQQYFIHNFGIRDTNLLIIGKEFGKLMQINKEQGDEIKRLKEKEMRYELIYNNLNNI